MSSRPRVVVCGGGVGAVEALLALRSLLAVGAEVHLVAPNRSFVHQPLSVAAPFELSETQLFDLADLARDTGALLHVDALAGVEPERRRVQLAGGGWLPYDALIVAVGARRREWLDGALHFGGAANVPALRGLLERLDAGSEERLAFVGPPGLSWTLPLYELALLTAWHLADVGVPGVELMVLTPESEPIEVFGPGASRLLRDLLADRGIVLRTAARAERIEHGRLHYSPGPTLEVENVVALSLLEGPSIPGLPADPGGFIAVDEQACVLGLADVYAVGDGTTSPIKQGGVAAQGADRAAEAVAARLGAPVPPSSEPQTLRAMLLTGLAPIYMRARVGAGGEVFELAGSALWWPPGKIAGRYLAPYLAGHSALTQGEQLHDRAPLSQDPDRLRQLHDQARELALSSAERDAVAGDFCSALQWLEVVQSIDGVLPPGYLKMRSQWEALDGR